jgi:hypothetical protein
MCQSASSIAAKTSSMRVWPFGATVRAGTHFLFHLLSLKDRRALEADIFALYEACLLDVGRMHASGGFAAGYYDNLYPEDAAPRTIKLGRDASPNNRPVYRPRGLKKGLWSEP